MKVKSKADIMFEKLGYKIIREEKTHIEYVKCEGLSIMIWKDKSVSKYIGGLFGYIKLEELQAINEKIKELKWLEEKELEVDQELVRNENKEIEVDQELVRNENKEIEELRIVNKNAPTLEVMEEIENKINEIVRTLNKLIKEKE